MQFYVFVKADMVASEESDERWWTVSGGGGGAPERGVLLLKGTLDLNYCGLTQS